MIRSRLRDLKNEIKKNVWRWKKNIEKPNEIVNIVEKIIKFNNQNQEGKGLKRLTPDQIFSRLPISLAQLKAGNNSEKLENEIRKLLYSSNGSMKIFETIYNSLINTIQKWKQSFWTLKIVR